ncbi:MAG TPA: RNA polymerase sigma factor [Clostridia bacterium]|nr:RNA polymerase sigma factor [Clostridia bacterium]
MDEQDLVRALKAQQPIAVQELARLYGDRLLRSAFLLCGNATDAEDIVQETFLQAIRSAHRFKGRSTLYTWLHSILLNLSRHYHRDRKWLICDDTLARHESPVVEETASQIDMEATSTAITQALQRLTAQHREVLILRYYEDLKLHEIATRLDVSTGTVKSRLHYAIGEMQKMLPAEMNLFGNHVTEEIEAP